MKQSELFPSTVAADLLLPGCQLAARMEDDVRAGLAELGLTLKAAVVSAGGRPLCLAWEVRHGSARLFSYTPADGRYTCHTSGGRGRINSPGALVELARWLCQDGRETQTQPAVKTKRRRRRRK